MNALLRKIHALIQTEGPITVAQYMAIALSDREHGYYMRRNPLGRDFITAPEVSQIFGELIGLFFIQAWLDRGSPQSFNLVELGPGRGTLMADMMRAAAKVLPNFVEAARIILVETSPVLRDEQAKALASWSPAWVLDLQDAPADAPLFLIANEFFDALPIRQFVNSERGWHERMVTSDSEQLRFMPAPDIVPASVIPASMRGAPEGSIFEVNPSATELVRRIAGRIAETGGVALIIDYGHTTTVAGDTLQAMKNGAFTDPFAEPGEADLTAHVDFEALANATAEGGAYAPIIVAQGAFLEALGIRARADRLKRDNPDRSSELESAVDRLVGRQQMGRLFKAMAIFEGLDRLTPPGFDD